MNCPIDDTELRITDRQGIEIDYCPKCRGVWLDRGELDKLIERAAPAAAGAIGAAGGAGDRFDQSAPPPPRDIRESRDSRDSRREYRDDDDDGYGRRPQRRRSFLDDIFDFD